jgi:hypothetical protein
MSVADTWAAFAVLGHRRLVGSAGLFRGIEIPESGLDEPLDDLEYSEYFYSWLGSSYALRGGSQGAQAPTSAERALPG